MARGAVNIDLDRWAANVQRAPVLRVSGKVSKVVGLTVEVVGLSVPIGEVCDIIVPREPLPVKAEVVGFRDRVSLLMPLGDLKGVHPGCLVTPAGRRLTITIGEALLGEVLNGLGRPFSGKHIAGESFPVDNNPPNPLERPRIKEPLPTGIRAVDALLTCGRGQRLGIFAGSGVGKSVLLGMLCRYCASDVNVVALIGERGREVRDFLERHLGNSLAKSVVVVATSDQSALVRVRAAAVATAIAEYFRDRGHNVMFLMDSVTRFALAQREIGLAIGEPPTTRGYTPSVFAALPKLLERSGTNARGTITGFYSVLVEGDDMQEPIADAVRGILDGHIILSRELAGTGYYPAIDILQSNSRLMPDVTGEEHVRLAQKAKRLLGAYRKAEDLINIGAYVKGSDPLVDQALAVYPELIKFLQQDQSEYCEFETTLSMLRQILGGDAD